MECSIILIAYHGDAWVPRCISTLAEHVPAGTHLVLVDNTGNRGIATLELRHFDAEIIPTGTPLGFAAANNLALSQATRLESAVAFLNQDTRSTDDWLGACIACLAEHTDVGAVTPLTRTYDGIGWDPYFLECARKSPKLAQAADAGRPYEPFYSVPVIPAAAMVARTVVLQQIGPFDPIFGSYYEDYDLCRRIRHAGFQVGVCTTGSIAHFSGSATNSVAAERRRARWVTRNRVIIRQREAEDSRFLSLLRYLLSTFPRGLARGLLGRPGAKPAGPYLAAHWDLLKLAPRLVSARRDRAAWQRYLREIGWPPASLAGDAAGQGTAAAA